MVKLREGKPKPGDRYGRLTAIRFWSDKGVSRVDVRCDCGGVKTIFRSSWKITRSCGCFRREWLASIKKNPGLNTRAFFIWRSMIQRCRHKSKRTKWYGMRGIKVCERWEKFENFLADMGDPPKGTSLDRIDPDGNYEPGNCTWADAETQGAHKRGVVALTIGGVTKSVSAWARRHGRRRDGVLALITEAGWTPEEALGIVKRTQ